MLALVVTLVALLGHTSQGVVGGTISGTILDERSRAPVVGARVTLAAARRTARASDSVDPVGRQRRVGAIPVLERTAGALRF